MSTTKLLLLMGPTGCGKTSIIRELRGLDDRFVYIRPYTTRPLRDGETDKVYIPSEQMDDLWNEGRLLIVNEIYGNRYGTPREPIECALMGEQFPLVDWPIQKLQVMQVAFPGRLFRVYIQPPSLQVLAQRLEGRDGFHERLTFAKSELEDLAQGRFGGMIDVVVTNRTDDLTNIAVSVYQDYLANLGEESESDHE